MMVELNQEEKISVVMIVEVIGKPPEHLTETLNDIIEKIGKEKGVEIKEKKVHDPIVMKDHKEFYTSFAEIEVEVNEIGLLPELMFKYMPAHVEILSPENLKIQNNELNDLFNGLMRKLHGYDEVARIVQTEKIILERKLKELTDKKPEKE